MIVGTLIIEIEIPHANSLKEKRSVLNRIRDRVHNKFNVSIAEIGDHDVWNYAEMGVAVVSNDQKHANQVLSKVSDHVDGLGDYVLVDVAMEFHYL